ncbi:MAG: thiamine-phosphate kinase, partial [Thioalkalispiraceae bacterium]
IGYKALAVNVSDIAAMGGQPVWFTLSISLPEVNHDWLSDFAAGLAAIANKYDLTLIGGDTTRGPLSITIQIGGVIEKSTALCRDGARQGDDIYVTGTPGDAAAGLKLLQQQKSVYSEMERILISRLLRPCPRVDIGTAIKNIATACIDISDGLAADLGHILEASGDAGAEIDLQAIPLSDQLKQSGMAEESIFEMVLHGGDDYELCFTAPPSKQAELQTIAEQTACPITRIGKIVNTEGLYLIDKGQRKLLSKSGFDHFLSP